MPQHSVLEVAGLYSADNPFSAVPRGALVKAENAVLRARNRIEARRGQRYWGTEAGVTFGSGSSRSTEGYHWGSQGTVFHYGTTNLARAVTSTITDYSGSYTAVDAATLRMKFVEAALNLYFNTSTGVYFLEAIAGTPALAGIPAAFDDVQSGTSATGMVGGAVGWLANNKAVAYRYVWGKKDSHDNVKLGAPSGRFIIRNRHDAAAANVVRNANVVTVTFSELTGLQVGDVVTLLNSDGTFVAGTFTVATSILVGAQITYAEVAANATSTVVLKYAAPRNTGLAPYIPPGITTSHFVRVYRSEETATADDIPGDDMYLVNELVPSSGDISTGYMSNIIDRTPSSQLGPPLYTSPNDGEGLEASKYRPPIGKDMCLWDGRMWCINTKDKHRFHLRLLGIGTPDGAQNNDTVTINGYAFTAKTSSASYASRQFLISDGSQYTAAQNISKTARDLVNSINHNYATVGVVAYYESGEDDAPGEILIEEAGIGGSAFSVYASRIASWGPSLTTGSSGAQTSVNDSRPHGVAYSDVDEPEAFRLTSWEPVAPKGVNLLRGIPHRDKLYCFAENGRVYTVSGPWPYRVDELESSALLLAPDTVQVHAGRVMALTTQGAGMVTDSGFQPLSPPVDDDVLDVLGLTLATVKAKAFAVSYEAEHQYQLWLPTASGDACATKAWVYNSRENAWTTQVGNRTWGRVNANDGKLYMGDGAANKLRLERKALDRTDYADESVAVTVSSYGGAGTVVLSSASGVAAGDILYQSATGGVGLVTAVVSNTLTLASSADAGFTNGDALVLKAFAVAVKWAPIAPGGPRVLKDFQDVTLHFRELNAYDFEANFDTETNVSESTAGLKQTGYSLSVPAAESALFSAPPNNRNRRVEVTPNHHSAAQLRVGIRIREAWALWQLHGFTVQYEGSGDGGRA